MLDKICQLARDAGDAIMQVYDGVKPMEVVSKADDSRSRRPISRRIR